ncbi:hypothetical protein MUDAN_BIHEEGNE_02678 [Lactiplantibacillus mudanjiangensis]|nr:hypothetical protein MUDAN_BIHEEGNE_02678 [Lactiplantibacillus mudanjiangensis]
MAPAVKTSLVRMVLPDFTMWKPELWLEPVPQPAESLADVGGHQISTSKDFTAY